MLDWNNPLDKTSDNTDTIEPTVVEQVLNDSAAAAEIEQIPARIKMAPVNPEDKRVINGQTDINQLAPFKYPWAWNFFLNANKNHWTPLDINMAQDVTDYRHKLTHEEKHVYENVLSYLTTSDILAMRNIGLAVMEKMSAPELQIYQARQVYEEALHTWTYQHCIETIGLDQSEIYNRYRVVPEIHQKIALANRRLSSVLRSDIDLSDRDELHNFVISYMFFAGVFEGCWFYNGFSPIFALQRRAPSSVLVRPAAAFRWCVVVRTLRQGFAEHPILRLQAWPMHVGWEPLVHRWWRSPNVVSSGLLRSAV